MPGLIRKLLHPLQWLESKALFYPERSFRGTPSHVGLEYEDVFPVADDGIRLHGWHILGTSDVAWLILHGNGGNVSVRLDQYQIINRRYGASMLAIDYRGYGRSDGTPSENGFYADALAAYEALRDLHPSKKTVVFGRSMGGAVAAQLASVVRPDALILEASISSIRRVIRERAAKTRFLPMSLILKSRFETTDYVRKSTVPTLIFHGDADSTVLPINSQRIFDAANQPKQLEIVPDGQHDGLDLVDPEGYHAVVAEFLEKYLAD